MEAVTGIAIENPGGLVRSRRETNEFFWIFWSVKLPYITVDFLKEHVLADKVRLS